MRCRTGDFAAPGVSRGRGRIESTTNRARENNPSFRPASRSKRMNSPGAVVLSAPHLLLEHADADLSRFGPRADRRAAERLRDHGETQSGVLAASYPEGGAGLAVEFARRRAVRCIGTLSGSERRSAHGE